MSPEHIGWNTSDEKKQEVPETSQTENETPEAVTEDQYLAERKRLTFEVLDRIDNDQLKAEMQQKIDRFEKEEFADSSLPGKEILVELLLEREMSSHLDKLAAQLPDGPEKEMVQEISSDFYSHSIYWERQYRQRAGQSDLASERHNDVPTAVNRLQAFDILHRLGIIDEEEVEHLKLFTLRQVEAEEKKAFE